MVASAQQMVTTLYERGGMTDEEIADETKVSQPTITRIRNGVHTEPKHSTWAAINEVYLKWQADQAKARKLSS